MSKMKDLVMQILALYEEKFSIKEISDLVGMPAADVRYVINTYR